MNPFDIVDKVIVSTDKSSSSSSDSVDALIQSLLPEEKNDIKKSKQPEDNNAISTCIVEIGEIRKNISQIKTTNDQLASLIHKYESVFSQEDRLAVQSKIASLIQKANSIAASGRFSIQTLKLDYNNRKREDVSSTMYNLYAQSYSSIARQFIDNITEYQHLQQRYEHLLEQNYTVPSILSDEKGQIPVVEEKMINVATTVQHQLVEACLESQMQNREIEMIQKSMREIQQMFFDLALLIDEQGEMLDYVQINIDTTAERTQETEVVLRQTIVRMKRMRKIKCCVIITVIILLAILALSAYLFIKAAM